MFTISWHLEKAYRKYRHGIANFEHLHLERQDLFFVVVVVFDIYIFFSKQRPLNHLFSIKECSYIIGEEFSTSCCNHMNCVKQATEELTLM